MIPIAILALLFSGGAFADARNLAPGFTALPKSARVLIMPPDVELFSILGGRHKDRHFNQVND